MIAQVVAMYRTILTKCFDWFTSILNAVGGLNFYYTAIFTAMTTGFLLSRFGSGLRIGSDLAAQHIKRKGDK